MLFSLRISDSIARCWLLPLNTFDYPLRRHEQSHLGIALVLWTGTGRQYSLFGLGRRLFFKVSLVFTLCSCHQLSMSPGSCILACCAGDAVTLPQSRTTVSSFEFIPPSAHSSESRKPSGSTAPDPKSRGSASYCYCNLKTLPRDAIDIPLAGCASKPLTLTQSRNAAALPDRPIPTTTHRARQTDLRPTSCGPHDRNPPRRA